MDKPEKGFIKDDKGKPQMCMLFDVPLAITQVVRGMEHGAGNYGRVNWRQMDDKERYLNAPLRHLMAYCSGQTIDPDSGIPHLALAVDSILFVLQLDEENRVEMNSPKAINEECYGIGGCPGDSDESIEPETKSPNVYQHAVEAMGYADECPTATKPKDFAVPVPPKPRIFKDTSPVSDFDFDDDDEQLGACPND